MGNTVEGTVNSALYQNILKENVCYSVCKLKLKQIIQQDNDLKAYVGVSPPLKGSKNRKKKVLEWPSQSPDLNPNPIEMLWQDFKCVVHGRKPSNVAELHKEMWGKKTTTVL